MQTKTATKPAAKPQPLITQPQPAPKVSIRSVVRRIAVCPIVVDLEGSTCAFNERTKPELHATPDAAQVEAGRHIRTSHAELLSQDVKGKISRQIVNETLTLDES